MLPSVVSKWYDATVRAARSPTDSVSPAGTTSQAARAAGSVSRSITARAAGHS